MPRRSTRSIMRSDARANGRASTSSPSRQESTEDKIQRLRRECALRGHQFLPADPIKEKFGCSRKETMNMMAKESEILKRTGGKKKRKTMNLTPNEKRQMEIMVERCNAANRGDFGARQACVEHGKALQEAGMGAHERAQIQPFQPERPNTVAKELELASLRPSPYTGAFGLTNPKSTKNIKHACSASCYHANAGSIDCISSDHLRDSLS